MDYGFLALEMEPCNETHEHISIEDNIYGLIYFRWEETTINLIYDQPSIVLRQSQEASTIYFATTPDLGNGLLNSASF